MACGPNGSGSNKASVPWRPGFLPTPPFGFEFSVDSAVSTLPAMSTDLGLGTFLGLLPAFPTRAENETLPLGFGLEDRSQ